MAETIKYVPTTVQPGDLGVFKDSTTGTFKVQNIDTGQVEQVYNTSGAAEQYRNLREAGQGLITADKNVRSGDPGQPSDSNTTATNTTSANTPSDTPPAAATNTTPNNNTTSTETLNGVTNTVVTTPPTAEQPSNQKVASVEINPTSTVAASLVTSQTSNPTVPQKTTIGQDWRVRLSLAPKANYLYKQEPLDTTDILYPLKYTDGVIFPYLPQINVNYKATYNSIDIVHTNYKNFFYTNSSVDEIQITAEFTAQDNVEARYMLAVIHFFKSVTKMFYGQDSDPRGGTPPPLCYLTGLGAYQFNNHPLVIGNFGYNLPNDVDYIRTDSNDAFSAGGMMDAGKKSPPKNNGFLANALSAFRLSGAKVNKGATPSGPNFKSITTAGSGVTYVPTKMTIQLTAYPIVTRQDISNNFKLNGKDGYGSGALSKKGIW